MRSGKRLKKTPPTRLRAERIAQELFTNEFGQVAERLVLYDFREADLGGLCFAAAVECIEQVLRG